MSGVAVGFEALWAEYAPVPTKSAKKRIRSNELELKTQTELLDAKKKEISLVNTKYDEDKRRYLELTRSKPAMPASAPAPTTANK